MSTRRILLCDYPECGQRFWPNNPHRDYPTDLRADAPGWVRRRVVRPLILTSGRHASWLLDFCPFHANTVIEPAVLAAWEPRRAGA